MGVHAGLCIQRPERGAHASPGPPVLVSGTLRVDVALTQLTSRAPWPTEYSAEYVAWCAPLGLPVLVCFPLDSHEQ